MCGIDGEKVKPMVESGLLDNCFTVIIVANALQIGVMSYFDFNNLPDPSWMGPLTFFFSVIYMVEVITRRPRS